MVGHHGQRLAVDRGQGAGEDGPVHAEAIHLPQQVARGHAPLDVTSEEALDGPEPLLAEELLRRSLGDRVHPEIDDHGGRL